MYRRTKFLKIARRKGRGAYEELDSCLSETLQWKIVTKNLRDPRVKSSSVECYPLLDHKTEKIIIKSERLCGATEGDIPEQVTAHYCW